MRRVFFLCFLILCIAGINQLGFCQGQEPALSQSQPQQEEPVSASTQQPEKIITAIQVKGNKSISTNTIVSKMKTHIGSPYQENVISDDLRRLYLLGFFSDIKIDTQDYKDGIMVIVSVVERPVIEKITFTGIRRITLRDEKLKDALKSKEAQYLDYPSLSEDTHILKKMYEKAGYSQAQIDYQVDIDKETNKAKVQFRVYEGQKIRIKDIYVRGNSAFPSRRILRLMKTKRGWLFNAGVLKEDVLKEDAERIRAFYRREGFTDVTVDYAVKPDARRPFLLYITLNLEEGRKYLVGSVSVIGNKDISREDILARLKESVTGRVYSLEALKKDTANIQGLYFDRGYISAQVQETTSVNSYTGRVDIVYHIVENEVAYVDKIKIKGNVKTKDVVIRRELRIHPADRFDGDKLRRSKERLQNLGFFEEVSYDTENTQSPDKKNLVVEVKEVKTGQFSFGGGFSTVDQFVGFVEIEQKNFDWKNFPYFTGGGQNLKFRASLGSISSGFDLSFTEPWVFDYPVSFGFDAYKRSHKREEDVGYGYDEIVTGGDLRLGKEISEFVRADLMYRFDEIDIKNITDNATNDLKQESGKNTISSITPSFSYDSRDNIFEPRKGDLLTGSFELAGGFLGGTKDFWKLFGRGSHYFPLPRNSSLELRGRLGLTQAYADSERVPIYERLFAGGAYTIRGYEERSLGPIDSVSKDPLGGEALLIGNAEYTYPVFDFFKLALFYDVGNAWEKVGDIDTQDLKSSVGLGLRVKTPIGPIMLDYGIPLNKAPGEDDKSGGKFHFSVSRGF